MAGKPDMLRNVARSLLQFLPLTVFMRVAFRHGPPEPANWLAAFLAGAALAGVQFILTYVLSRGRPMNRMMLGVNAYLMLGGVAVLSGQIAVLGILNNLRESGIFLCLLAVGIVTSLGSGAGFIGEENLLAQAQIRRCSLWMLVLTGVATAASFYFRGNLLFSAVIPMIVLAMVNRVFKTHLRKTIVPAS